MTTPISREQLDSAIKIIKVGRPGFGLYAVEDAQHLVDTVARWEWRQVVLLPPLLMVATFILLLTTNVSFLTPIGFIALIATYTLCVLGINALTNSPFARAHFAPPDLTGDDVRRAATANRLSRRSK